MEIPSKGFGWDSMAIQCRIYNYINASFPVSSCSKLSNRYLKPPTGLLDWWKPKLFSLKICGYGKVENIFFSGWNITCEQFLHFQDMPLHVIHDWRFTRVWICRTRSACVPNTIVEPLNSSQKYLHIFEALENEGERRGYTCISEAVRPNSLYRTVSPS